MNNAKLTCGFVNEGIVHALLNEEDNRLAGWLILDTLCNIIHRVISAINFVHTILLIFI